MKPVDSVNYIAKSIMDNVEYIFTFYTLYLMDIRSYVSSGFTSQSSWYKAVFDRIDRSEREDKFPFADSNDIYSH